MTARGGRVLSALAVGLVVDGWLLLAQLTGAARWAGIALLVAAVPIARLGHRPVRQAPGSADPAHADVDSTDAPDVSEARPATPSPAGSRARRISPAAVRWSVFLLVVAGVFAVAGAYVGAVHRTWPDHAYLVDVLAGLTTCAIGLAAAVVVLSVVAPDRDGRRSLDEARVAAGQVVGDMMAAVDDLLAERPSGYDWRTRGRRVVHELQRLARDIDTVVADASARADGGRVAALNDHWRAVVGPRRTPWRRLEYAWSVMNGDIRTRLMAAGDWIPEETALRVGEFVRRPDSGASRMSVDGADPAVTGSTLAASREYVERLLVLTVQLLDLGELYEPPETVGRGAGRTEPSASLGGLSALTVEIDLTSRVATAAGYGAGATGDVLVDAG